MYAHNGFRIKRYFSIILPFIGVIIIILMLVVVWFWETTGRQMYFYKEVVVLNQDVKKGTIITAELIQTEEVEVSRIINHAITEKNSIIGLEAKQFIPKGSQLHPFYFESPEFITENDRYIVRIPNDWIYSIPNTLRRKDDILFYLTNNSTMQENQLVHSGIQTHDESSKENINEMLGKLILETKVAYVKDSANREVETISMNNRLNGTSVISEILVILTPEQLNKIEKSISVGSKIIIMHKEGGDDA